MADKLRRRDFIKGSAAIGLSALCGGAALASAGRKGRVVFPGAEDAVVAAVRGDNYLLSTQRAVDILGGMAKFVSKGARVAILPNSQSRHPGAFTKPEIVRATIQMCRQAGAKEVNCLSWLPEKYWEASGLGRAVLEEGAGLKVVDLKDETLFKSIPLPKGKVLKEARIMSCLFDYDIWINLPIMKDHAGNKFTGTLKNLMGLNLAAVNRSFHTGDFQTKPDDVQHLDQCIADLNLAVKPTLCIVDATEFITTNGPFGPGQLAAPRRVVAGVDRVAVDSYCTTLLGMKGEDIVMIKRGYEHGLGEIDLKKVKIREEEA